MKAIEKLLKREFGVIARDPFRNGRVPLHAEGFPLVLLFSQKSGCTSFTRWFLHHIGKLEEALALHPLVHRYRTRFFTRQPGYKEEAERLLKSGERPVVKLVRNPYDRAVSSFIHTVHNARERENKVWERQLVADARERAGKPQTAVPTLSFRDYMRHLAVIGTTLNDVNRHIAMQFVPDEKGRVDRLIRLERFDEEIRRLEADYGLPASPLELVSGSHHHKRPPAPAAPALDPGASAAGLEITRFDVLARRLPPYAAMYDEETAELVRRSFAPDFEEYGYDVSDLPGRRP